MAPIVPKATQVLSQPPKVLSLHCSVLSVDPPAMVRHPFRWQREPMENSPLMLSAPLLEPHEETELAVAIEAGVYAEHLLAHPPHHHQLEQLEAVVAAGRQAWQQLYLSNLRLVMKVALAAAYRQQTPVDELFQEGCLALGEAMRRFDYRRGNRLSTFVHDWLTRHIARAATTRCGLVDSRRGTDGSRHFITTVPLDDAPSSATAQEPGYERVEQPSLAFLDLLGTDGLILKLRFGIGTKAVPRSQVGARLGVSATTIKRFEERALHRARRLLSGDQCRVVAA